MQNKFIQWKVCNLDGRVSLSTLVLLAGLIAVFVVPGWQGFAAFVVAVLNHNAKRYYAFKTREQTYIQADRTAAEQARIDRLESEVKSLIAANDFRKLGRGQ